MFEKYLKHQETDDHLAIVKPKHVEALRASLRLVPGVRKHGKNALEIPAKEVETVFWANKPDPYERILWQDGMRHYPQSAVKNPAAPIDVEYIWVFKQRRLEEYLRGLKK